MLEQMGSFTDSGELVRLCYPPTWYQIGPTTLRRPDGSEKTLMLAGVSALRNHEVMTQLASGMALRYSTQVFAFINVIDPATAKMMGGLPCETESPARQQELLVTCETESPVVTSSDTRTYIHTAYFLTEDGYRLEGRAVLPSPRPLPVGPFSDEEYAGLEEEWPGLLADMTQIAGDFASRANERSALPVPSTATAVP